MDSQAGGGASPPTLVGGRYELRRQLDTPAAAPQLTAWRGYDQVLRREVRIDLHTPGGDEARGVVDHALASGAITHPALARVLDVADDGDRAYVVSAWINGAPLSELLDSGPMAPGVAAGLIGQIADGVAAAHRAGATVGVVETEQVVVDDVERATLVRLPVPAPTTADDVRGLGALLYAALTAHWPLDSNAGRLPTAPTADGRLTTPQQIVPSVPADLSAAAMRALYPELAGGIATAEELAAALADSTAVAGSPPEALPLTMTSPPPRKRTPGWLRIGVPAAAVVAVGLVTWLVAAFAIPSSTPSSQQSTAYVAPTGFAAEPSTAGTSLSSTAASSNGSATASPTETTPSATTPPPLTPVPVAQVIGFDPYGKPPGDDNAKRAPLAADGDPATQWQSDIYRRSANLGGLKPGTGLIFDLQTPQALREIDFTTTFAGMDVQILTSDTMPTSPDKMHKVATVANVTTSNTVKITDTTKGRYWVIWLTKLAPIGGDHYRGGLSEVRFSR